MLAWSKVCAFPTFAGNRWIDVASVASIEYSLDLDLPDDVFENPIVQAMSDATNDLMTWPNVGVVSPVDAAVADSLLIRIFAPLM